VATNYAPTVCTSAVLPVALGELNAVAGFVALPLLLLAEPLLTEARVWASPETVRI